MNIFWTVAGIIVVITVVITLLFILSKEFVIGWKKGWKLDQDKNKDLDLSFIDQDNKLSLNIIWASLQEIYATPNPMQFASMGTVAQTTIVLLNQKE